MDWTEIKVTVDTSTVEVVTNHIHEAGAGGIVIQHHGGNSSVTAYFPQGSETEHFLAGLTEFGDCLDIVMDVQCAVIADQDWSREWKKHYQPIQVGRVYITPSDRKSTRLNSSHVRISYAVFCLKKKITTPLTSA